MEIISLREDFSLNSHFVFFEIVGQNYGIFGSKGNSKIKSGQCHNSCLKIRFHCTMREDIKR